MVIRSRGTVAADDSREEVLLVVVVVQTGEVRSQSVLVLIRACVSLSTVLQLQEVRLREVVGPSCEQVGMLFLVSDTANEIDVMLTESAIVCNSILGEGCCSRAKPL